VTDVPLTPRLSAKLASLFAEEDQPLAEQWLIAECGENLPLGAMGAEGLERIRTAALKVSRGSLDRLALATSLAQRDWRDLLMGADFGDDIHAHETWLADDSISK
jgi:hypothetical protein